LAKRDVPIRVKLLLPLYSERPLFRVRAKRLNLRPALCAVRCSLHSRFPGFGMAPHLKLSSDEVAPLRSHYQGIAHDVLRILWRHRILIALFVAAGLAAAVVAIVTLAPRYTSEAILQVSFNRDEPNTTTKTQRIASMEATGVVESAVRILRSRALASAVVSRLDLANDPAFSTSSRLARLVRSMREMLKLPVVIPTAEDIAAERLAGVLQINIVPRSYVVSIAASAGEPERAAQLANAVVIEYLRGLQLQQLAEIQRNLERDIADISAIYGAHHPRNLDAREKLRELQVRIAGLRRANMSADAASAAAASEFLPAEAVMMPSGPSAPIVIALILAAFLLACGVVITALELKPPATYRFRFSAQPVESDAGVPVVTTHSTTPEQPAARRLA
jgi:capsular polysaccharide biosynthesis protein